MFCKIYTPKITFNGFINGCKYYYHYYNYYYRMCKKIKYSLTITMIINIL